MQTVFIWVRYGKIQHSFMNNAWAFRRTPYSLNMCCIVTYRTKNEERLYFLTRSSHTWHNSIIHCAQSSAIWADTVIRLIVKTTAQSVRTSASQKIDNSPHRCMRAPTPPPPWDVYTLSPADQRTFSRTAGQSQAYYNRLKLRLWTYDVSHLHNLTCTVAAPSAWQCVLLTIIRI